MADLTTVIESETASLKNIVKRGKRFAPQWSVVVFASTLAVAFGLVGFFVGVRNLYEGWFPWWIVTLVCLLLSFLLFGTAWQSATIPEGSG